MQSITIDILNNKAMKLLKDLELLQLIKLRREKGNETQPIDWSKQYKGAMMKQPISDIETQLNELRKEWE